MPWRLIAFIIILGFVVFFAGFNTDNVSDISFGFHTLSDVPIFLSLFVAFLVGVLIMTPFLIGTTRRKSIPKRKQKKDEAYGLDIPDDTNPPQHR